MNHRLLVLFSLLIMLIILDTVTTYVGLTSRKATEINPLHENLNSEGMSVQFILIKNVFLPSMLCVLSYICLERVKGYYRFPYYALLVFVIVYYCFVVGNNLAVLGGKSP